MSQIIEDLRESLRRFVRGELDTREVVVRRQTRTADARADGLVQALANGVDAGRAERITGPSGQLYFMYGVSGYGGSEGFGD